jgi:hypothetical protein
MSLVERFAWIGLTDERQLEILKFVQHWCLVGSMAGLAALGVSRFFPGALGLEIAGLGLGAVLLLLPLSLLLKARHFSVSVGLETAHTCAIASEITEKAESLARQWQWATAVCKLPR